MPANVRINGSWRDVSGVGVRVAGTWRSVSDGWIRNNGSWSKFYQSSPFMTLVPSASDGYTLSGLNAIATVRTGAYTHIIENGHVRFSVNGNGRGAIGTGQSGGPNASTFQVAYSTAGNGAYDYSQFGDAFQPGTPHEMVGFLVDGTWIGGGNDNAPSPLANGTVYSWQTSNTSVVVLLGSDTGVGHAVLQYITYPGKPVVHMRMSYTNTTNQTRNVKLQRGGDPDFDQFDTLNFRGYSQTPQVAAQDIVYATGRNTGRTIALVTKDTITHNSLFTGQWPLNNPDSVLAGGIAASSGDHAMYLAWNFGNVAPGQTVSATCAYLLGTSIDNALSNYNLV